VPLAVELVKQEAGKFSRHASATMDLVAQAGRDRLSGSGDFGSASNSGTNRMIGIQFSVPLFTGGYRGAKEVESLRMVDKATAELERTRQQVTQQVRAAWLGLSLGAERVHSLDEALAASLARADATQTGRDVGRRTTLDLLNVENDAAAAHFAAGAQTPMAGVISAALMSLVLLGLTGLFERLPLAVLAATIIVAVLGLVDLATPRHAWQYDRADALAWAGTALGVLGFGVEAGIGIGVALSAGTFLWRASRPHIAVLGRLAGTEHFRNEQRFEVETQRHLLIMRIDENLFFANSPAVLDRIEAELAKRPATCDLLLVLSSVSHIDLTAAEALEQLLVDLQGRGVVLHLAEIKGPVLDRLKHAGRLRGLAHEPFVSVHAAVQALQQQS